MNRLRWRLNYYFSEIFAHPVAFYEGVRTQVGPVFYPPISSNSYTPGTYRWHSHNKGAYVAVIELELRAWEMDGEWGEMRGGE